MFGPNTRPFHGPSPDLHFSSFRVPRSNVILVGACQFSLAFLFARHSCMGISVSLVCFVRTLFLQMTAISVSSLFLSTRCSYAAFFVRVSFLHGTGFLVSFSFLRSLVFIVRDRHFSFFCVFRSHVVLV